MNEEQEEADPGEVHVNVIAPRIRTVSPIDVHTHKIFAIKLGARKKRATNDEVGLYQKLLSFHGAGSYFVASDEVGLNI